MQYLYLFTFYPEPQRFTIQSGVLMHITSRWCNHTVVGWGTGGSV